MHICATSSNYDLALVVSVTVSTRLLAILDTICEKYWNPLCGSDVYS